MIDVHRTCGSLTHTSILLDTISCVEEVTGFMLGRIAITVFDERILISNIERGLAAAFVKALNKEILVAGGGDPTCRLERVAHLRDGSALTETEFVQQKARILSAARLRSRSTPPGPRR